MSTVSVTFTSCSWTVEPGFQARWDDAENVTRVFREPPCDCCNLEEEEVRAVPGLDFNVTVPHPNDHHPEGDSMNDLTVGVQKMVESILAEMESGERTLILARSVAEMKIIAEYADPFLKSNCFSRVSYHLREGHMYTISLPFEEIDGDPPEVWVASIDQASPEEMTEFTEYRGVIDRLLWPDVEGVFALVAYQEWNDHWYEAESHQDPDSEIRVQVDPFRPKTVFTVGVRYSVGVPRTQHESKPVTRKVSVWEHVRRNALINTDENGKEVNQMAAKKSAAKKTAKKTAAKKAVKSAKKSPAKKSA